eukprot:jgi/Psemu1/26448/gm1.26448_g
MPAGSVLLNNCRPSVFHFILHYSEVLMKLYDINFDLDKETVCLSTAKTCEGSVYLPSPLTKTEQNMYLVKQWLIRKMVNWQRSLLAGEIAPFDNVCKEYISKVLCASMWAEENTLDDSFENRCKALVEKVFEFHQWILMEHSTYVFRQIFVTDLEVLCNSCVDEWLPTLTLLAKMLVEVKDNLSMANLEVVFLSRTEAHNTKDNDLCLSGAFKHLKGSNILYCTLSDLESWYCFFESKEAVQSFKSMNNSYEAGQVMMFTSKCTDTGGKGLVLPWLVARTINNEVIVQTVLSDDETASKTFLSHDDDGKLPIADKKGNTMEEAIPRKTKTQRFNLDVKPPAKKKNSKELAKKKTSKEPANSKTQWRLERMTTITQSLAKIGNNKKLKNNVPPFKYYGCGRCKTRQIEVMFEKQDLEIMYPMYQIGEPVYVGVKTCMETVKTYPGYELIFPDDDGGNGELLWFPYFKVAPFREEVCHMYTISDVVLYYSREEDTKDEAGEDGDKCNGHPSGNKKNSESGNAQRNNKENSSSHSSSGSSPSDNVKNKRELLFPLLFLLFLLFFLGLFSRRLNHQPPGGKPNPILCHFETGFHAILCAMNGQLVLTILDGCKQTDAYVNEEVFPNHDEGDSVAMDYMWAMSIILLYLSCGYPALKGTEDIKCYNNVGIGPEVESQEQKRLEQDGHAFPAKEWCNLICIHFHPGNRPFLWSILWKRWIIKTGEAIIEYEHFTNLYYSTNTSFYHTGEPRFPLLVDQYTKREVKVRGQDTERKQSKEQWDAFMNKLNKLSKTTKRRVKQLKDKEKKEEGDKNKRSIQH